MPDDADDRRQEAMLAEAETLMTKAEAMLLTRGERWTQLRLRGTPRPARRRHGPTRPPRPPPPLVAAGLRVHMAGRG